MTARQIEAARRTMVREMKRRGKIWIRIFPDKPYTRKPPETRMGKGKGNVEYWVAVVRPGRIMFEISGLPSEIAIEAMRQATYKFSIKTKVVTRHEGTGEQLMKMTEMRLLSRSGIEKKLDEARNELMNLRFQVVTGQLTDTSRFKQTRRTLPVMKRCSRANGERVSWEGEHE